MLSRFAAIAAAGVAVSASAQVIDFQSLEHNDANTVNHGGSYTEDGFTINDIDGIPNLSTFGTQESRYPGSTALFNNTVNGEVELVKNDGGIFTLTSIDISRLNTTSPVSVTFTGSLNGTVVATQTFTTTISENTLETFNFNTAFSGVDRVTWAQVSPFHQFDNINVVPEGARVVDFQRLAHNDSTTANHGYSYTEDGFVLTTPESNPFEFASRGTQQSTYAGSTGLFNNTIDGVTTLRDVKGRPFSLLSIELADLSNNGPVTVTFTGRLKGAVVGVQSFTTTGSDTDFRRFNFNSNFARVDSVSWAQNSPFHQFDNIRAVPVGPDIIDFEQLEANTNGIARHGYAYAEHDYTLQYDTSGPVSGQFGSFGLQEPRYPGSTALFNDTTNGVTVLRRTDGRRFNLISIDVANLNNGGPDAVRFEGIRSGAVVATQTYTALNASNELETVVMTSAFRNLDSVRWVQDSPFNQFDNINVEPTISIDFQALAHNDALALDHGTSYAENNMIVSGAALKTFGTKESRYPGSTAMYNNVSGGDISLVHGNGDRFSVTSIDISRLNTTSPVSVDFTGLRNGNVVATQTFTTTVNDNVLETFFFNDGFLNVDEVVWSQDSPFHQFDNIVFGNAVGGCPADLDGDGDADSDDFFAYLDAFANNNQNVCDIDGDGDCDSDDFFSYLDLFAQGC